MGAGTKRGRSSWVFRRSLCVANQSWYNKTFLNTYWRGEWHLAVDPGGKPMELHKMSASEQQMSEDFQWALTAPEVQQHHGKFVAVYQKRVVGVGTDRMALVQRAAEQEKCHWGDIAVVVVPGQEVWEMPHETTPLPL
jgi:hypothetical protein